MFAAIVFAAITGLVIGSFLNVVIHRLPLGESVVTPRSRCPHCGHEITAIENVPVLSWLFLRGKCRECKAPISPRYPLVELGTGILWAAVVAGAWDDGARIALGLILVTALVPITAIDLEHRRIPNVITGPTAIALIVAGLALDLSGEPTRLMWAVIVAGPFFALALIMSRSMGLGDAKLMGVMGLALGRAVIPALFIAFFAGTLVGLWIMSRHGRQSRKTAVPFGPFLALGALIAFFVGDDIVQWYLDDVIG
ncbi:MAG: prepilin peptidase [Solirubrobacteraceae bacterium]|nr:prepilin peptidase [Solirubrobacteraceae bacterium]